MASLNPSTASVFYPSLATNLIIRFDEVLTGEATTIPLSADGLAAAIGGPPGPPKSRPRWMSGGQGRGTHRIGIVPKSGTVELPAYRSAGKFNFVYAFKDLPIDPRAIRAIGVEVYIGAVTDKDFARGMRGEKDGKRLASILLTSNDNLTAIPENFVLAGTVDNITATHNDKGSEVKIDGRDLRGLYLDGKIAAAMLTQLHLDRPINEVVAEILSKAPDGADIQVHVDTKEWVGGTIPSPGVSGELTRVNKGVDGQGTSRPVKGDSNSLSYWDIITQYCFLVGAIPYFIGYELWIRPARSIFKQVSQGTADNPTPFKDGKKRTIETTAGKRDIVLRKMVYGRDLLNFAIERKLGGIKTPTVKCVSVDTSSTDKKQVLIEAEYPDEEADDVDKSKVARARVTGVDAGGQASKQDKVTVPVSGINDKSRLRQIAQDIYEEIGRGEMGGNISTKNLASLGGDNGDTDIVRLRPGDAIELVIDATGLRSFPPIVAELALNYSISSEEAVRQIARRLSGVGEGQTPLDQDLRMAQVIVGTTRSQFQKLQSVFRVSNVKYTWALANGIAVDFDFQNYVEARNDVTVSNAVSGAIGAAEQLAANFATRQSLTRTHQKSISAFKKVK